MLRNITTHGSPLVSISAPDVCASLGLTHESFIDFALLLGTDFTRRIKNQRTRNQKVRRSPLIHTGWLCADSCARRARRRGARVAGRSTGRKLCERFLWLSSRCSRPLYVSLYINGIVASETRTQLAGAAAGNFLTGVSCVSLFVLSKVSIIV